jgi:hypothetical protein
MNIEEEVMNHMGKEIQEDIDFEIQIGMLKELGWIIVTIPIDYVKQADDWIKGKSRNLSRKGVYAIEDKDTALVFQLKWI